MPDRGESDTDGLGVTASRVLQLPQKDLLFHPPWRSALARRTLPHGHFNVAGQHEHLRLLAGAMAADYLFDAPGIFSRCHCGREYPELHR